MMCGDIERYWDWHMEYILKDLTYSTNRAQVVDTLDELDSDVILVDEESEGLDFFELEQYRLNKAIRKLKDIHENKIVEKWLIPVWNGEPVMEEHFRKYWEKTEERLAKLEAEEQENADGQ